MSTLLLADDDFLIRKLLQPHLQKAGFYTVTADNGVRAVELIMKLAPHLIILDVTMPEMDGLAVLRMIRSLSWTRAVPVIMITSSYDEFVRNEAKSWGAVGFLTKPFGPKQLLDEIKRARER
jgi:two-component system chemotaxis response regulator CheY